LTVRLSFFSEPGVGKGCEQVVKMIKWFYKPLENMTCNLAVMSDDDPFEIRFVDQSGHVFDRMMLSSNEDPEAALLRNGFVVVEEGGDFSRVIGIPHSITDDGGEKQPVYSSGRYWRIK